LGVWRYAVSPLILLAPIILVTYLAGEGPADLSPVYIVGVAGVFFTMSAFYIILCQSYKLKAAVGVAALANGVAVVFFAALFGSVFIFTLLGFTLVLAGIIIFMTAILPSKESLFARKIEQIVSNNVTIDELRKLIDSIQFPCVFLERESAEERIIAYNAPFAEQFKLDRQKIIGSSLEKLLPVESGAEQIKYGGEEWVVKRTVKGRQALLMLYPAAKPSEAAKIEVFDAIDPATGLYVEGFMKYKARSDLESIRRGKRRLTTAMFKVSFPERAAAEISEEEQKLAYVIFGRIILQSIRACDTAYRTGDNEVLLFMPDTPTSGAEIVISRVYNTFKRTSAVECPNLSKAVLDYADRDYLGGGDLPPYDKILEDLSVTLYRKNPDLAVG
jgi:GGDEF domain-containing protein